MLPVVGEVLLEVGDCMLMMRLAMTLTSCNHCFKKSRIVRMVEAVLVPTERRVGSHWMDQDL